MPRRKANGSVVETGERVTSHLTLVAASTSHRELAPTDTRLVALVRALARQAARDYVRGVLEEEAAAAEKGSDGETP
ncbi:MAG: hypothetical protein ED558_03985 [Oricola sp.]|nr:MAG: hypothetical protein ED558_03985 [Oricola sp.]